MGLFSTKKSPAGMLATSFNADRDFTLASMLQVYFKRVNCQDIFVKIDILLNSTCYAF